MQNLLTLTIIVEPDRQRLVRFAMSAAEELGGNVFSTANRLDSLLPQLRDDGSRAHVPIEATLRLEDLSLFLVWGERQELLANLAKPPANDTLNALATRLKHASESTDSTLLKRRNEQIIADLEIAKQRARAEMDQLEKLLETKKNELTQSIQAAQTDSLTGLYNRGGYDSRLHEAVLRCKRQREPLCLILLDLDKFKEINDTHGHQVGDEFLKRMADSLRSSIREHVDHACRMGGDEFAIVLFSDMSIAKRVADRILKKMDGKVSIGIAGLRENDTVESLIARTDTLLYEAKHRGRGQFVADEIEAKRSQTG